MLAGYSLHADTTTDYLRRFSNARLSLDPTRQLPRPVLQSHPVRGRRLHPGTTFYHNENSESLQSNAVFGEAYYTAIPDTLNFTAGLRYTEDTKSEANRILFQSVPAPIERPRWTARSMPPTPIAYWDSITSRNAYTTQIPSSRAARTSPISPSPIARSRGKFVADWTPRLESPMGRSSMRPTRAATRPAASIAASSRASPCLLHLLGALHQCLPGRPAHLRDRRRNTHLRKQDERLMPSRRVRCCVLLCGGSAACGPAGRDRCK